VFEANRYFEDYQLGHKRTTAARTITEADIVIHAGHVGDYYPHQIDAEWSAKSEFHQRIAHGTLTFAVGAGLTAGEINPDAFSYGHDRLRFVAPVSSVIRSRSSWRLPASAAIPSAPTRASSTSPAGC
jgi:acyl dehydratase